LPGRLDFKEEVCAVDSVVLPAEDSARVISAGVIDSVTLTDKPGDAEAVVVAFIDTAWVLATSDETGDVCVELPTELNFREAVSKEDSVALPSENSVLLTPE